MVGCPMIVRRWRTDVEVYLGRCRGELGGL